MIASLAPWQGHGGATSKVKAGGAAGPLPRGKRPNIHFEILIVSFGAAEHTSRLALRNLCNQGENDNVDPGLHDLFISPGVDSWRMVLGSGCGICFIVFLF